jgi:hypothetical protein
VGSVAGGAAAEDSAVAFVAVSEAGADRGAAGLTRGLGAGLAATTLSLSLLVSWAIDVAVSGERLAAVSPPEIATLSPSGTEPDRRSPPQPVSVAHEQSPTTQIGRSSLSCRIHPFVGAAGPDTTKIVSLA